MQFIPRFETIEAHPFALLDEAGSITNERGFLVTFEDGQKAVVDSLTWEQFFRRSGNAGAPAASPAPPRTGSGGDGTPAGSSRKTSEAVKETKAHKSPKTEPVAYGQLRARILDTISRSPKTSGELIEFLKVPAGSLYSTCNQMKEAGLIVSRNDTDETGLRKWYPIPTKEQK